MPGSIASRMTLPESCGHMSPISDLAVPVGPHQILRPGILGKQAVDILLPICAGSDENNRPSFSCILMETLTHFVTSRRVLLWDTLAVIH